MCVEKLILNMALSKVKHVGGSIVLWKYFLSEGMRQLVSIDGRWKGLNLGAIKEKTC